MSKHPGINRASLISDKMWLWVRRQPIKWRFNRQRLFLLMYLLLQRPPFIRYSLNSLTQWQEIGSFKLTENPYSHIIQYNSLLLFLLYFFFTSLAALSSQSLLSPIHEKAFWRFRDSVPTRKCVRRNNWNILSICTGGEKKNTRVVICFSV